MRAAAVAARAATSAPAAASKTSPQGRLLATWSTNGFLFRLVSRARVYIRDRPGWPFGLRASARGRSIRGSTLPPERSLTRVGENARLPAYTVNEDAVRHAKRLIDARQYVVRSRWQDVQPRAREQNVFLKTHQQRLRLGRGRLG
jgi:hypothetical protein